MAGVDGLALASIATGALFLYAAVQGKTVLGSVQVLIRGASPSTATDSPPITASDTSATTTAPAPVAGGGSVQEVLQETAAAYGWGSGAQWQALQNIEMAEAGYDPNARNPSGAYGIAQALGHGLGAATQGTQANEYGGFGVSDAVAQAANSGDAAAQAAWMCAYISQVYGDPVAAWAYHLAHNSY